MLAQHKQLLLIKWWMEVNAFRILPLNLKMKSQFHKKEFLMIGCLVAIFAKTCARGTVSANRTTNRYSIQTPKFFLWAKRIGKKSRKMFFRKYSKTAPLNEPNLQALKGISTF